MKKQNDRHAGQRQIWISKRLWDRLKKKADAEKRTLKATCEIYLDEIL